jgi:hypothetical protein
VIKNLFDGLEGVVGFPLDDSAQLEILHTLFTYWFHPSGGVPYVDYRRIIRSYIRRASAMSETRYFARLLAMETGLFEEICPPPNDGEPRRPPESSTPLYRLPLSEPKNLSRIKKLICQLDRVDEVTDLMTPALLEQLKLGRPPVEFSLTLADFKRDVEQGKELVLEYFPTLQWLFDEIPNERRLRDALRRVVLARETQADEPIPRRGERRRRKKSRNWKKVAARMGLRQALHGAAELNGTALRHQDFENFLQNLNMRFPKELALGTAQAARDAIRKRVRRGKY